MSKIPDVLLDFENNKALFETAITKTKSQLNSADLTDSLLGVVGGGIFDTGLLHVGTGSGLLALRGGFGHLQIVYQVEPGINHVIWGDREGDSGAGHFQLAQPYRVWIADFFGGNISGARHFYTLEPVNGPDTVLHHVNLPNTNCQGYSGTGVGWMCLYHKDNTSQYSIRQLIEYAYQRAGGGEAYNDANMSETDGPRFYQKNRAPKYFTDPAAWQKKSLEQGWQWTLDEKLLIPIKVISPDSQERHGGDHILTIDDAMNGTYYSSYPYKKLDQYPLKPVAAFKRGILLETYPNLVKDYIFKAIQSKSSRSTGSMGSKIDFDFQRMISVAGSTKITEKPKIPMATCDRCEASVPEDTLHGVFSYLPSDLESLLVAEKNLVCESCFNNEYALARIDMLYSVKSPADGGLTLQELYVPKSEIINVFGVGSFYGGNTDLLTSCISCGTLYPRFASSWNIDYNVYTHDPQTNENVVLGCIECFDYFFCEISKVNVVSDFQVNVSLLNYLVDPPQPYSANVASWLVLNDNSPYKICACNIVAASSHAAAYHEQREAQICKGCWKDEAYVPIFEELTHAVDEHFSPHAEVDHDEEYDDEYDDEYEIDYSDVHDPVTGFF